MKFGYSMALSISGGARGRRSDVSGRRREWKLAVLVIAVGFLLTGQGPLQVEGPVRGQVIDRDSKQPIAGATVRLFHGAHCPRLVEGYTSHWFPKREAQTDAAGLFEFERKMLSAPCLGPIWSGDLEIIAPGYRPEHRHDSGAHFQFDRPIRSGVFELERWSYRLEFERFRELWKNAEAEGGVWGAAVARARRVPFGPAGPPGIFVSHAGAQFSRIAVTHVGEIIRDYRVSLVLAQDLGTKKILGWEAGGRSVPLPWARTPTTISLLAGDQSTNPMVMTGSRLYYPVWPESVAEELTSEGWQDQGVFPIAASRAVLGSPGVFAVELSGGSIAVSRVVGRTRGGPTPAPPPPVVYGLAEALVDARPPLECLTSVRGVGGFRFIVVIAGGKMGRTSFVISHLWPDRFPWDADQVPLPAELAHRGVVACAGGTEALYLSLQGGGIRKLRVRPGQRAKDPLSWVPEGAMDIVGQNGSLEFTGLTVGKLDLREVVYAIAEDTIYRFASDGRPDQRIEALPRSRGGCEDRPLR